MTTEERKNTEAVEQAPETRESRLRARLVKHQRKMMRLTSQMQQAISGIKEFEDIMAEDGQFFTETEKAQYRKKKELLQQQYATAHNEFEELKGRVRVVEEMLAAEGGGSDD